MEGGEGVGGEGGYYLPCWLFFLRSFLLIFTQNKGGGSSPRSASAVAVRLRKVPFVVSIHREAGHQTTAFS